MTAAEFYAAYCERSGVDPAWLASMGQRAYRCSCGEPACEGWQMRSKAIVRFHYGVDPAADDGYAPDPVPT